LIPFAPIASFITAFLITFFSIPAIIRLSLVKRLYDKPDNRKQHKQRISPLGGIAIFGGMLMSFVFFSSGLVNPKLNSLLVALFVLFITGVKDDLFPLTPYKKFLGQILAIGILVFQGDVRLESLYGLYNIGVLPYWTSVSISILFFLGIVNSFNFIDGINGLSSGLGLVVSLTYAFWFSHFGEHLFLILALSNAGAQLAFLRYNLFNAKIFMGDSGSMILGFLNAAMTIYFLQANERFINPELLHIDALVFASAVLVIPVADTLRVIFYRVFILRVSPLHADRNHIHHLLLDIGITQLKATLLLVFFSVLFTFFAYYMNDYFRAKYLLILVYGLAFALAQIPQSIKRKQIKLGEVVE